MCIRDRMQIYQTKFGDPAMKARDKYVNNLIELGNKSEEISNFMKKFSSEQIRQLVKSKIFPTYRDVAGEFLNHFEKVKNKSRSTILDTVQNEVMNMNQKLTGSMPNSPSAFNFNTNLYNLHIDKSSAEKAEGYRAKIYEAKEENYFLQLRDYIQQDKVLSGLLSILLTSKDEPCIEAIRIKFLQLLTKIYQEKLKQILGKEIEKFNVITPLLTNDLENPLIGMPLSSQDKEKKLVDIKEIDNALQKLLVYDFHKFIQSHLFFMFSLFGLEELGQIYKKLYRVSQKIKIDKMEKAEDILNLFQMNDFQFNKFEDISKFTSFLDTLTQVLAILYYSYRNKLLFPEDKLMDRYTKTQLMKERDYNEISFLNYVVTAFIQNQQYAQKVKQFNQSSFSIQYNTEGLEQYFKTEDMPENDTRAQKYQGTISAQLDQLQQNQNLRQIMAGAFIYIHKLDLLTRSAIYGRSSFLPEENDLPDNEMNQIFQVYRPSNRKRKLDQIKNKSFLQNLFEIRFKFEKKCSKQQLVLFDLELSKYLSIEEVKNMLHSQLDEDIMIMKLLNETIMLKQFETDRYEETLKLAQEKKSMIRNQEAEKKLIAYTIMINNKYDTRKKVRALELTDVLRIQSNVKALQEERYKLPKDLDLTESEVQNIYRSILGKEDFSKNEFSEAMVLKQNPIYSEIRESVQELIKDRAIITKDVNGQIISGLKEFLNKFELSNSNVK
eukprot:TRINITY_DN7742_c0_g1_i2.p1 TRINITY_DN7742_c0_g1~~TRINITY_DN7742_c0_g1_i2.p1  ORF type:complete len:720 (-),score=138.70 TRINITY_DN7742_c0_g1_i2:35-2194(-)